jgi:hypothetical protein
MPNPNTLTIWLGVESDSPAFRGTPNHLVMYAAAECMSRTGRIILWSLAILVAIVFCLWFYFRPTFEVSY